MHPSVARLCPETCRRPHQPTHRGCPPAVPCPQFALSLVLKESFQLYKAVSEGVINLAGAFFEMEYHDASECTHTGGGGGEE